MRSTLALTFLALATPAHARDLRFEDAVRTAIAHGPEARGVHATAESARAWALTAAAWQGNPQLEFERRPDETALTLSVPLEVAGQPAARRRAARLTGAAADLGARAGRASAGIGAGRAYLDAVRARERDALARSALALAERLRDAAARRRDAGEASPGEAALQAAQAAHALTERLTRAQESLAAAVRLAALLGEDEPPTVAGWPAVAEPPEVDPRDMPRVQAAATVAAAAAEQARAARLERIPDVQVRGGWGLHGNEGPIYGVSLSLPVLAPGIAAARAERADAEAALVTAARARLDATASWAAARAELRAAEQVAAAWAIDGLDAALDAAARRYEAGETPLGVYLSERDLALTALSAHIDARWRLERARLDLWELAGQLPPDLEAP